MLKILSWDAAVRVTACVIGATLLLNSLKVENASSKTAKLIMTLDALLANADSTSLKMVFVRQLEKDASDT